MGPSASIGEHFPFIQAEHNCHQKDKPENVQSVAFAVDSKDPACQAQAEHAQNPLEKYGITKKLHIDNPLQIIDGNPGQHVRDQELAYIVNIRKVAVHQPYIIGVHHISGGFRDVPDAEGSSDDGQHPVQNRLYPLSVHIPLFLLFSHLWLLPFSLLCQGL